jgi:outer membrane murein-binding lipoprotein Lpp
MDIEAELLQLKRRVDDLEGAINVLAGQVRAVHPEVVALKSETTRRFDAADGQMNRLLQRLDTMNSQVWSLRDDLPSLIRQAIVSPGEC